MKSLFLAILILISGSLYSQVLKDTATYAFPIGTKFTLELIKIDSVNYKYHILSMEPFNGRIDYADTDSLFSKSPIEGTLEGIFAEGKNQDGPFKSVLVWKNNSDIYIDYKARIDYDLSGRFYSTSVYPILPRIKASELWNDNLKGIVIHKLQRKR